MSAMNPIRLILLAALMTGAVPTWALPAEIAVLTNKGGKVSRVVNLQAVYHPGGHWIGEEPPSIAAPRLLVVLEHQDRRTESIAIPFAEISELKVEKRPGPLGPAGAWLEVVDVRRRDGSAVTLALRFEARDTKGTITRALSLNSWTLSTGLVGDRHNVLQRLEGSEILPDGSRKPYRIDWPDLKSLRFE